MTCSIPVCGTETPSSPSSCTCAPGRRRTDVHPTPPSCPTSPVSPGPKSVLNHRNTETVTAERLETFSTNIHHSSHMNFLLQLSPIHFPHFLSRGLRGCEERDKCALQRLSSRFNQIQIFRLCKLSPLKKLYSTSYGLFVLSFFFPSSGSRIIQRAEGKDNRLQLFLIQI